MTQINIKKLRELPTGEDLLKKKYGEPASEQRAEFNAKAMAWYYAEILKDTRKNKHITQEELANKIGRERSYIARLERGETDMQLSTFLQISHALGLEIKVG